MVTGSNLPSPILPLEVIYEILEIFIQNERLDLRSIRACSLVCRDFVPPCQALIFSKLDVFVPLSGNLDGDFPNKQTRNLSEILQRKPHLAAHIVTLHWGIIKSMVNATPGLRTLFQHIQKCNKIQTLRLYSLHSRRKAFKDARPFDDYQIMPFIKRLEINNIHLSNASGLFSSCTNLKEVQLDLASKSNDMDGSDTKFRPRIELYDDYTYLDTFHAPDVINFSNIRVFKIYPGISDGPERFKSLLKLCAGTVEELHLKKMQYRICQLPLFLDFSFFLSLRVVDLDIDVRLELIGDGAFSFNDVLPKLNEALASIPAENRIETLILNFFFNIEKMSELETCLDIQWELLTSQIHRISSGKPLHVFLHMAYKPPMIIAVQTDRRMDEKFGSQCKSAFESLILGKRLTTTFPSHIICNISQRVFRI